MQKGKQALLLHLGVCLCLCSTIVLPCRCLLLLITLPHALRTFSLPPPSVFNSLSFHLSLTYMFSFPIPCPVWKNIHLPLFHFIYFFLSFLSLNPHIPQSVFSSFLSFSPLLAMLQCSCGNFGIMPVVLWPWLGGQFLRAQRGASAFFFCLCKLGVLGSVLDWKDEQLEGWRPVGANRGHRGHHHSKPFGSQLKGRG